MGKRFRRRFTARIDLGFEASGGGIPVIRALMEGPAANNIQSIYGIINGTSNYILSRMTSEGQRFEVVLEEAKRAGMPRPILPSMSRVSIRPISSRSWSAWLTAPVNFKEIYTEGITGLTPLDIAYAKEFGFTIKLLAIAKFSDGEIEARVHPTMVPSASQIAKVDGVYNAIQLVGDAVEDVVLYGRGAGRCRPAVPLCERCDVHCARHAQECDRSCAAPSYQPDQRRPLRMRPMEEITSLYYIRFMVLDRPGVLSQIAGSWVATASVFPRCCSRDARKGRPCRS